MRHIATLFLLMSLAAPIGTPAQTCTGLCQQQVSCPNGGTTSISGTVYAPNGADPLPNILVYVPSATPTAFPKGIDCPTPGTLPSGSPLVGTTSGADGTFTVTNVPVGTNIPLVIQSGRWRRQVVIPKTTACSDTAFPVRMPKNQSEGDIPQIAVATGTADSVECVLRKVGIDDSEFTNPLSTGRIHLYAGTQSAGATINASTPSQSTLMDDPSQLAKYDLLMLPCQGSAAGQTTDARLSNILAYANAGGRVYASHYSYAWFYQNGPFSSVATWPATQPSASGSGTATINTAFSGGQTLSDWLQFVGATTTPGQVNLSQVVQGVTSVNPPTQSWITLNSSTSPIMQITWNTPVSATNQCGRILYNEYHVESNSGRNQLYPAECSTAAMTSQEKLLEYSLFDLTNSGSAPTLLPMSKDFGSVAIGFRSTPQTFTWTNNTIFPVTVSSAVPTGDFAVTGNPCKEVAQGASCQIAVVFQPTQIGAASGTLTVTSNANKLIANLAGTGVSPISVSSSSLGFPNTDVGATSYQSLTLTNVASGSVVLALNVTGDYATTSTCPASLAAGASCTVKVGFTPTTTGSRPGTLTVNGNVVTLLGTGVDFSVAFNPASGTVIAGEALTAGVSILPISGFSAPVSATCTTNAPASTCSLALQTLVPSESAQETIKITTTSRYTVIGYSGFGKGLLLLMSIATGGLILRTQVRAKAMRTVLMLAVLMAGSSLITGCSDKLPAQNASYTPAGSYTYTVTATDGFLKHSATYSLTVTVK